MQHQLAERAHQEIGDDAHKGIAEQQGRAGAVQSGRRTQEQAGADGPAKGDHLDVPAVQILLVADLFRMQGLKVRPTVPDLRWSSCLCLSVVLSCAGPLWTDARPGQGVVKRNGYGREWRSHRTCLHGVETCRNVVDTSCRTAETCLPSEGIQAGVSWLRAHVARQTEVKHRDDPHARNCCSHGRVGQSGNRSRRRDRA